MCDTPYTLSLLFHDGSSEVNGYADFERATWNFTDAILKRYCTSARITIDGGRTTLARWARPASEVGANLVQSDVNVLGNSV